MLENIKKDIVQLILGTSKLQLVLQKPETQVLGT